MIPSPIDETSIDALIASGMPAWLGRASVPRLHELNHCLQLQQDVQHQLQALFGRLTALDAFAQALLDPALAERLKRPVSVRKAMFDLRLLQHYPVSRAEVPGGVREQHFRHSLLAAALHNFSQGETLPLGLIEGSRLLDEQGQALAMTALAFAELCRTLDVGGQYQAYLERQLTPPGEAGEAIAALLEQGQRSALESALRLAALRGEIDERVFQQCLPAIRADKGKVAGVQPMELRVLGKRANGVVVFEVSDAGQVPHVLPGLLCWIPADPHGEMTWHGSWAALFEVLGKSLRLPGYAAFFQRFIGERERVAFSLALSSATPADAAQAMVLDGRWQAIDEPLFEHLRKRQLALMFDDAQVLAVPTRVHDAAERERRLHFYLGVGLDVLNLAAFYVPGLGAAILGIAALQVVDELYEGYRDWTLGDRQGALEHVLSVAVNLSQMALAAGVGAVGARLLQRSAFVDELAPVVTAQGRRKLIDPRLADYALAENETAVGQHAKADGHARLGTHQAVYQVTGELVDEALDIRHPQRTDAYAPKLRHMGAGTWRHEFELPQFWQDTELVRRLGSALAEVDEQAAREVLLTTGISADQLRQLHLEQGAAPARLLDALQRQQLHERLPRLRGEAFEQHVAEQQVQPGAAEQLLRRDFPGLTVRTAGEIVAHTDESQVALIFERQRVPLQMAECAWWSVRESRIDRACAGLLQAAACNADTESLAFGLLGEWLRWPEPTRLDLREQLSGVPSEGLMQALWERLDAPQRQALGNAGQDADALALALAQRACDQREQLPGLLGMVPSGGRVRAPWRLADGRIGYPLSGRGEGSQAALRRALMRLFPGFGEAQLNEFLASPHTGDLSPWNRLFQLQDEFRQLENALSSWRRESVGSVQAVRRGWVARRIRQAWQRLGRNSQGGYLLRIHGWRVGALPNLPEQVDLSHITHLSLTHMDLLSVSGNFLEHFSQLRRLDLQGNLLTALPGGLERLGQLRELQLARNHIQLRIADAARINTLRSLHTLVLSGNLLGRAPEVSALLQLRSLHLRGTGLRDVPQGLLASPSLTLVDLRENHIGELSDSVIELMRSNPGRVQLHGNPLSNRTVGRLRALFESLEVDPLPAREHVQALEDERLRWLEGVDRADQPRRLAQWDRVQAEEGAQDLFRFFADFSRSRDFARQRQEMSRRVWGIIEACELNSEVREAVFLQAAGARSCADQMLLILSALEVRTLAAQRTAGLQGEYAMRPLLRLGRELFRLDQVDRIASRHILQMRAVDFSQAVDDVEVHLAYRVGLAQALGLPGQPSQMNYASISGVHSADLADALAEVRAAETRDALCRSLTERDFWQSYLHHLHDDWFENMNAPFHERLDLLYEQRQQLSDQDYRDAVEVVQDERLLAERALMLQLTLQAYDRHPA